MKKRFKNVISVALATTLALGVVGCGQTGGTGSGSGAGQNPGKSSEAKANSADCTFEIDDNFNLEGIDGYTLSFAIDGDDLYVLASTWEEIASLGDSEEIATIDDAGNYTTTFKIYKTSLSGGKAEVVYEKECTDDEYFTKVLVNDGKLAMLKSTYKDETSKTYLCEYNGTDFEETLDLSEYSSIPDYYVSDLIYNDKGQMIIVYDTEIKVLDVNKKEISSVKADEGGYFDASSVDKDGNIVVCSSIYDEEKEEDRTIVRKFDSGKGEFTEEYDLNVSYLSGDECLFAGSGDYDFFYRTKSSLFGYKYKDKSSTKLVEFAASDINADEVTGIILLNENEFICFSYGYSGDEETAFVEKYKKVDPSEVANQKIVTLASVYGNHQLNQMVSEYNKSHEDVKIRLIDYSEESNPEEKFSADIAAGDIPDIFDTSYGVGNMSTDQCIAMGLFEDLAPYVEKDPDISKEDFFPTAYDALLRDGKQYFVASSFEVHTLLAKASEVGEDMGWTFQEMRDYIETKPEDVKIFYSTNKKDMLDDFMYSCGMEFIDWDKGECYFDSQEFKDILEICNRGTNEEMDYEEETETTYDEIKNGNLLFVNGYITPASIQVHKKLFDNDLSVKGYPDKDTKGTYFSFTDSLAMSSTCEDKDAAWDFIRQLMTEEYCGKHYQENYGVPLRQDVFEAYIESISCTEASKDKYGNDIMPQDASMGYDGLEVKIEPVSDADVNEFKTYIDNASGVWEYDAKITEIVEEEAQAYFSGDKSLDDTCAIIQNRVTTYINENK